MKVIVNIDDSVSREEIQNWIDEVLMKMPPVIDAHIACNSCTCDDSKHTGADLEKAKRLLEIFVEEVVMLPGCYRTMIVDDTVLEAKRFLNWRI